MVQLVTKAEKEGRAATVRPVSKFIWKMEEGYGPTLNKCFSMDREKGERIRAQPELSLIFIFDYICFAKSDNNFYLINRLRIIISIMNNTFSS